MYLITWPYMDCEGLVTGSNKQLLPEMEAVCSQSGNLVSAGKIHGVPAAPARYTGFQQRHKDTDKFVGLLVYYY
jgi:hypothetical protein